MAKSNKLYNNVLAKSNNFSDKHFAGPAGYFNISDNAVQCDGRNGHLAVIIGMANREFIAVCFKQHGQRLPDATVEKLPAHPVCDELGLMRTAGLFGS